MNTFNNFMDSLTVRSLFFFSFCMSITFLHAQGDAVATVTTDKPDYAPSETAYISAAGFQIGEAVEFLVLHIDGKPNTGNGHTPWTVTDGGPNDNDGQADGNIETSWFVDPDDSFNSVFELTAIGQSSALTASHTFKDDTPVPTGLQVSYNYDTNELTLIVDWGWTDQDKKVPAVAVFADIDGDGTQPDFTDNPADWVAAGGSYDEFLGQTNLGSILGSTSTTCSGFVDQTLDGLANTGAGIANSVPHVLMPYGLDPIENGNSCDLNSGPLAEGTFTVTYTGFTQAPATLCVVVYDVHLDNDGDIKDSSGNHSPISAGDNRNTDNSVEEGNDDFGVVSCDSPAAQIIFVDLALEKTVSDAYPSVGDNITFYLTVTNESLLPSSSGFTVEDILPSGFTYVSDNGVLGNDYDTGTNKWAYNGDVAGHLTAGSSTTLEMVVTVNGSGSYENYAQIETDNEDDPDSIPGDDSTDQDDNATLLVSPCAGEGFSCNAIRWEGGSTWNVDSSIDDTPSGNDGIDNMAPANGIISCGSSAETQSNIQSTGCYDPGDFVIDLGGESCVEPSSGNEVFPANPTPSQPLIWLNFDVRSLAGTFQVQVNDNSGDNIAWALYHAGSPQEGVTLNTTTGEYLSGDCSNLTLTACGVESANTWNTLPVPNFTSVTNYYLVIWDQDGDGDLSVNNFKARFGCGVCDGSSMPEGDCDCEGNILDACGICGGSGIPDGDCDCDGNENDECGICGGSGIPAGDCDCDGNILDACGICGGDNTTCL
ncbi:MAG: DUF11 domain-containing protein, partial [Flavobacteriales bacterium]|nr:DUF11 domain-containing protein [Flavobacteriales bacterium]